MTDREIMEQALEALEKIDGAMPFPVGRSAITALRTAIEQAEKQEPVAWRHEKFYEGASGWFYADWHSEGLNPPSAQLLYTTPPAAQPCPYIRSTAEGTHHCALSQRQPLTDEQIRDLWSWSATTEAERTANTQQHAFARAIEAAHGIGEKK